MANREQRVEIAQETINILEAGGYTNSHGVPIDLKAHLYTSLAQSKYYDPEALAALAPPPNLGMGKLQLSPESSLEAAQRLVQAEGYQRVLCLNFASAKNPGGGFLSGSQAQEESLARSSALYLSLQSRPQLYDFHKQVANCLYSHRMIYSPSVPVIRDHQDQLLLEPYLLNFITSPAVNKTCLKNQDPALLPEVRPQMQARAELVLRLAHHYGHRVLVLGAWGCGVFGNDPALIAQIWRDLLLDKGKYEKTFDLVVFAVLDQTKDRAVYRAFEEKLGI